MTFADELSKAIAWSGYNVSAIARELEIPLRTVQAWMTGYRTPPKYVQKAVLFWVEELKKKKFNL